MLRRWVVLLVAAVVLAATSLNAAFPLPGQEDARPWAMGLMAFPVAAALVLAHRPGNPVGRLLGAVGVAAGVIFVGGWFADTFPGDWSRYVEAVQTIAVVVQFWAIIALLYVFPSGVPRTRMARTAFLGFSAWMGLMALLGFVRPGPLDSRGGTTRSGWGPRGSRTCSTRDWSSCRSGSSSVSRSCSDAGGGPTRSNAPS